MTRRSRITRGALAVLAGAWMLASPASMMPARAQSSWPFQLEWTQTGARASYYRLCVNGACTVLHDARNDARAPSGGRRCPCCRRASIGWWSKPAAPRSAVPGEPDLMIRVVQASPRRPPIDVIDGPRIPVSR